VFWCIFGTILSNWIGFLGGTCLQCPPMAMLVKQTDRLSMHCSKILTVLAVLVQIVDVLPIELLMMVVNTTDP